MSDGCPIRGQHCGEHNIVANEGPVAQREAFYARGGGGKSRTRGHGIPPERCRHRFIVYVSLAITRKK